MNCAQVIDQLQSTQIVAILRSDLAGHEARIADTLIASGITIMEVSLVSPNALDSIRTLAKHVGIHAAVGAGTVLTENEVDKVADSGATFIVSPDCEPHVIAATLRRGLASFPGTYTPTEVMQALRWGSNAVKIFPAASLGPQYIAALRAPFPRLRMIPTGGITTENITAYLQAGAWAVGVGSDLVPPRDLSDLSDEQLSQRARAFVASRSIKHA